MVINDRQAVGRRGEEAARIYLKRRGVRILERNFVCAAGEVDLIGKDGDSLVFFEVKSRTSDRFGPPHLAVHRRKQQQIVRAAQWYLSERRLKDVACRFDVVAITFFDADEPAQVDWVQNAFPAEGEEVW